MLSAIAKILDKPDLGFLIVRVVAGSLFVAAGINKFLGGSSTLEQTGSAMAIFGLGFAPIFWGVLAALTETVGGALLVIGFLFRGAAFFLMMTMVVATVFVFQKFGLDLQYLGFPLVMLAVSAGLMLTGPGKIAAQKGGA